VILSDISLVSQHSVYKKFSGLDHPSHHRQEPSKTNFLSYPYQIDYRYNSRGFRDNEWPSDLKSAIWCFGDSFTAGIGVPFEHTWPQVLAKHCSSNTVNISMDGASNDWIARKVLRVLNDIAPRIVVIHWSYIHRREKSIRPGDTVTDDLDLVAWYDAGAGDDDDVNNLIKNITAVEEARGTTQVIHTFIPGCCPKHLLDNIQRRLPVDNVVPFFLQLDHGRDLHHYDIKTSQWLVDKIASFIK
jgi:hypothetical protein